MMAGARNALTPWTLSVMTVMSTMNSSKLMTPSLLSSNSTKICLRSFLGGFQVWFQWPKALTSSPSSLMQMKPFFSVSRIVKTSRNSSVSQLLYWFPHIISCSKPSFMYITGHNRSKTHSDWVSIQQIFLILGAFAEMNKHEFVWYSMYQLFTSVDKNSLSRGSQPAVLRALLICNSRRICKGW